MKKVLNNQEIKNKTYYLMKWLDYNILENI